MKKALALSLGDLRNIRRDSLSLLMLLVPAIVATVVRFGLPLVAAILLREIGFDLAQHYPFAVSLILMINSLMIGTLAGFLILDERDDSIVTYLSVTPLTRKGYLFYRAASPMLLSFLLSFFTVYFTSLASISFLYLVPVALLVSLEAPIMALFLGVVAGNKVEGLALSKAAGVFFLAPVAGYLIKSRWVMLAGILPPFWISETFLAGVAADRFFLAYVSAGLASHLAVLVLLVNRFARK